MTGLLLFFGGAMFGGCIGVFVMCLLQINRNDKN